MTENIQTSASVDGHLRFLSENGEQKELSGYTLEIIDSRARQGLRRWFHVTPHEAVLVNSEGAADAAEVRADIEDLIAVLRLDDAHVEGWVDVAKNACESVTYTVNRRGITVNHSSC